MNTAKHTPGPWRMTGRPEGRGSFGIWSDSGSVASATKGRNGSHYAKMMCTQEGLANARLIAAAPDMYEALTGLVARHKDGSAEEHWAEWDTAIEAIAKAEGGAR